MQQKLLRRHQMTGLVMFHMYLGVHTHMQKEALSELLCTSSWKAERMGGVFYEAFEFGILARHPPAFGLSHPLSSSVLLRCRGGDAGRLAYPLS